MKSPPNSPTTFAAREPRTKNHEPSTPLPLLSMTQTAVRWIKSTSWELPFFGLPQEIPWPGDVDPAIANQSPFEVEHLLNAIEQLGPEAQNPWKAFLAASEH